MTPLGLGILCLLMIIQAAILALLISRLIKKVPPNTIMIVTGGGTRRILTEGRVLVIPLLHRVDYLPVSLGRHELQLDELSTEDGKKVRVELSVEVKVNTASTKSIETALKNFLIPDEECEAKIRDELKRAIREFVSQKSSSALNERELEEALLRRMEDLGVKISVHKLKLSVRT